MKNVALDLALATLNSMEIASHNNGSLIEQIRNAKTTQEKHNLEVLQAKQQKEVNELKKTLTLLATKPNTTYSVKGTRKDGSVEPYLIHNGWETPYEGVAQNQAKGCNDQWGDTIEFVVIENNK